MTKTRGRRYEACIVPGGYNQRYGAYSNSWEYKLLQLILDCCDETGGCEYCPARSSCLVWWRRNIVNKTVAEEDYNRLAAEFTLLKETRI